MDEWMVNGGPGWGKCGIELGSYPDTMPLVKNGRPGRFCQIMNPAFLRPRTFASFMAAMFWFDACKDRGVQMPELVLPMIPGARQDRLNPEGDYLFTAKSVAREINMRGFPKVIVLDPHSDVAPALIDRCRVIHAHEVIDPPAGKYSLVVSPDAGAEKRASLVAKKLGTPLLHAWKTRDVETGEIAGFGAEHYSPRQEDYEKPILVVDDICDGGGTFIGLGLMLAARGFKTIDLWTTHGLYTQGTENLLKVFRHLYCSDSYDSHLREGAIVVPFCERIMKGELCI